MRNCGELGSVSSSDRTRCNVTAMILHRLRITSPVLAAVLLLSAQSARAQFSANFQTITLSGVTSNWAGNGSYVVGSNTFFDTLQIINSAVLSNGTGVVGYSNGGSNNTAIVSGAGSLWKSSTNLFVGFLGAGNQLIVTNGGRVLDPAGALGYTNVSQNVAWVTGPGSVWSNTQFLYVGYSGSANQLIVTNGGLAWSGAGYVGVNNFSSNNLASIIGTGSVWMATNDIYVGFVGSSNQLIIANGGNVSAFESRIGFDPFCTNNIALVTGSGSTWSNQDGTIVGFGGVASQLIISNGATVFDTAGVVGETNQSSRNTATVTGSGSVWLNTNALYDGFLASSNQLVVANGGVANALSTYLAFASASTSNLLAVTGTGSILSNTFNTYVGAGGSSNELRIANGATVFDEVGILAVTNTSIGNVAWIDGPGSVWSNSLFLAVGYNGRQNQLVVTNGGSVFSGDGYLASFNTTSASNTATITGNGSLWGVTNGLYIGYIGASNQLFLAHGGATRALSSYLGFLLFASNNLVTVTDPNSIFSNAFNTYVGFDGPANRLVVSNGALAFDEAGVIGFTNSSFGNVALVDGVGSVWSNTLNLFVGYVGSRSQLIVTNGGAVYAGASGLGEFPSSSNNTAVVTGVGSTWLSLADLSIGFFGSSNSLTIKDGGVVIATGSDMGEEPGSSNNTALITGIGSVWSNAPGGVGVGDLGGGNSLTISNGGGVLGFGVIGGNPSSSNNSALVTGAGSTWTNTTASIFYVGNRSRGNTMQITSGGTVFDSVGILGYFGGTNNLAVVSGPGSVWNNTNQFYVGYDGYASRLVVSNSGAVFGGTLDTYLGQLLNFGANSNTVLVSGSGSIWSNPANLFIGEDAYGNSLIISNGGVVFNNAAWLGYGSFANDASNNLAVVTGAGSVWNDAGTLTIGKGGTSNQLFVTQGGLVIAPTIAVGQFVAGNLLRMTNGMLQAGSINIAAGNTLSGSGFVSGNVVNLGTVSANVSGGTLTFENGLKNQGFVSATNGGILSVFGTFFNLGTTSFTGGTAIFHGPVLSAQGTTNLWAITGSGPWEQGADWSLGVPSTTNAAILVTNAVSKTITVSSNTFASAPGSVTNFGIRFSAPSGSTNILLVANTPAGNPFVMINLTIDTNAVAIVTNAILQVGVQSSGTLTINGKVQVTSGGLFDSSNTGTMNIGLAGSGAFSVVGGGTGLSSAVSVGVDSLGSTAVVSDIGSVWSNGFFQLDSGSLMITNGGTMISLGGDIGGNGGINGATGIVSDTGSVWITDGLIISPDEGENDQLIITNGGAVYVLQSTVAVDQFGGGNNQLIVSGNGALLDASPATLYVGLFSFLPDRVDIGAGGTVFVSFVNLGQGSTATNLINVTGGSLFVTNAFGSTMQVFQGMLALNGGTVTVDDLILKTNLGVVAFSAGTLYSAHTEATNGVPFVVGDGTDAANFNLLGGVHSFNSLEISNAAVLSGCGTVTGNVRIDAGGTVLSDCGTLTFTGIITNNGTLRTINGGILEAYSNLVNNGTIDIINGGVTNFHGAFINNGTVLDAISVKISQATASGQDFDVQIPSVTGHTYQLQFTPSLTPTNWTNISAPQPGTGGVLTFTDSGGATNSPTRFYRVDCTAP